MISDRGHTLAPLKGVANVVTEIEIEIEAETGIEIEIEIEIEKRVAVVAIVAVLCNDVYTNRRKRRNTLERVVVPGLVMCAGARGAGPRAANRRASLRRTTTVLGVARQAPKSTSRRGVAGREVKSRLGVTVITTTTLS